MLDSFLEERKHIEGKESHCILLFHGYLDAYFYKQLKYLFLRLDDGFQRARGVLEANNTRTLILAADLIKHYNGKPEVLFEVTTLRDYRGSTS